MDQVSCEQGANGQVGAKKIKRVAHNTPEQPGNISCGVCVLIEIQRIMEGGMDSR